MTSLNAKTIGKEKQKDIFIFTLLALLFLYVNCVHGREGITIAGRFNVTGYRFIKREPKVWPEMSSTNDFRASFSDEGSWKLEILPTGQPEDTLYLSFDGTNTFSVEYQQRTRGTFEKNGRPIISNTPIREKTNYSGINLGEYPLIRSDEQFRAPCLWVCLAAGHYIKNSNTPSMPLPWEDPNRSLTAYGFRFDADLLSCAPYAPRHLSFLRSVNLDLPNLEDELKRPFLRAPRDERQIIEWNKELEERRKFFPDGFMAGELQTEGTTNMNGFCMPLISSLKIFYPGGGNPVCGRRYDVQVVRMSPLTDTETFAPPIIAPLSVRDQRFRYRDDRRAIDKIDYILKVDEKWPSQDSPQLKSLFVKQLADRNASAFYSPKFALTRRTIAFICLALLGTLGPFVLYKMSKRRH